MAVIPGLLERAVSRVDTWWNALTGVGIAAGRNNYNYCPPSQLSDEDLESLYSDAFAGRVARIVPAEALRQGFRVTAGDPAVSEALHVQLRTLHAAEALFAAWTWSRVFGGGAVLVGADDGRDPAEPLDESAITSVRYLVAVDRRELIPLRWYTDPLKPTFGSVEVYSLNRVGGASADTRSVHASRLLKFRGTLVTRRRQVLLQGWGESELQRIYTELQQFRGAYAATATLLNDASQGVFKIEDFTGMMAGDKQDVLRKRLEFMDMTRSIGRSIMVDAASESFDRVESQTLTGLPDVLRMFLLLFAGAAEIPVTLLMGQAPAGLNATGDSDVRNFYDRIKSDQVNTLQPHIERLVRLLLRAQDGPAGGQMLPAKLEFNPLWQMTEKERAELRKTTAETDQIYLTAGVVLPEEVAVSRFPASGWSPETTIDLDAREHALEADREAGKLPTPTAPGAAGTPPGAPGAAPAERGGDHAAGVGDVVARVAAREIPRDAGVAQLTASMGLTPEEADAAMGEAGKSFFTKPAPEDGVKMEALTGEHTKLKASHASLKAMLKRVLAKNKAGELVVGSPVGAGGSAGDVSDADLEAVVNEAEKAEAAATP